MDLGWSEEQLELRGAAVEFARRELSKGVAEADRRATFRRDLWLRCAAFGIQGLPIPTAYGGGGRDLVTTMLVMEGLGYGGRDNGILFALNAQLWSVELPILMFGTEDQRLRYLPGLCRGELIGAHGMTEPESGSDAFALRMRATRVDGGYRLTGSKVFVTNAPVADVAVVFATIDPMKGRGGVTAFLVERARPGRPGFEVGPELDKMGLRTAPMAELVLEECFVPDDGRLGPEGAGPSVFRSSMEWERSCILASHVGAMERQLEACVRYARQRRQFGQPIGRFQSVSNRIADMKVRLETARLLLAKVAWLKDTNRQADMDAAIAKLYVSEAFVRSSLDAIAIHGGYGYATESEIERDMRDAVGGTIYSGTSDIQRMIIARWLGL
jgi:alkylation response protein AidB-like acyl-CoA dehydrogenase